MSLKKFYTTVAADKDKGGFIAVISIGSPQKGDSKIRVCEAKRCSTVEEGMEWGRNLIADQKWREENARPEKDILNELNQ